MLAAVAPAGFGQGGGRLLRPVGACLCHRRRHGFDGGDLQRPERPQAHRHTKVLFQEGLGGALRQAIGSRTPCCDGLYRQTTRPRPVATDRQANCCNGYSVPTGLIGNISLTCGRCGLASLPKSTFFLALVGSRLSFRLFDALCLQQRPRSVAAHQEPVLIYGAGRAGKLLYEEAMFSPHMQGYVVMGFIDDNPHCVGRKLCGVPVQHGRAWLEQAWDRVPEIWVSSRFIPEARALLLAAQWQGKAVVRRFKLEMDPPLADAILAPTQPLSYPAKPRSHTLNST